jgi:hypothetical protein
MREMNKQYAPHDLIGVHYMIHHINLTMWSLFSLAKWKHITVTPFVMSHCIVFFKCVCLSVSHFKLSKDFHNILAYYVRI